MVGRLLRMAGTVLVIAAALVVPVLTTAAPASAAEAPFSSCTIVANPTATNFTNCPNTDFSGADLTGVDLSFANLAGSTFTGVDVSGTIFDQANLSQATFSGAKLTSCTAVQETGSLQFWTCGGVDMIGTNLQSADLSGTDLSGAVLQSADLVGANISNVTWEGSLSDCIVCGSGVTGTDQYFGANTTDANLSGLDLSGLDLSDVTLTGANLTGAQLQNSSLSPVASSSSNISGADLAQTNFTDANLSGAGLSSGNFSGATLTDSNLTGAILAGATLTGATLTGATVTGTVLMPKNQVVTATSSAGAVVSWALTALPGATPGSCTPASGSTLPVGTTTVTCQVVDDQGGIASGTFQADVLPPAPPPTTSVLLPSAGATEIGDSWLDAAATSSVGIASVRFEVTDNSGNVLDVSGSTPTLYGYIGAWNSTSEPNGTYTLQSVATDIGGQSTTSAPVTITVDNPPPSTSMLLPANGATQSGTNAVLDAIATADVESVSFELNGATLSDDLIPATATIYGWLAVWDTTSVPNGTYTVQSVGTESDGTTVTSAPITITVSN